MLKKLSMIGLCGVSLVGLTGCSTGNSVIELAEGIELNESSGSVEFGEVGEVYEHFEDETSLGLKPVVLFEALNELEPELALNESVFEEIIDEEWGGGSFVGAPTERVLMNYTTLQDDEWTSLKDKNSVGMLGDLSILFDKTDEAAAGYVTKFMNAFNTIAIKGLLDDEVLDISEGFTTFDIYVEPLLEEDLDEESLYLLEKAAITNVENLYLIRIN